MVIRRTGNRSVEGLPGWEVEEHFPFGLEYREGGKVLRFDVERAGGPGVSIILYDATARTHWQKPHHEEPLSYEAQHPILVRVTAAVLLLGVNPIWESNPPEGERKDWPVIWQEAKALLRRAE
jgi:hypothetical protein